MLFLLLLVNVTKNFKAMEMHERDVERQNFIAVRKLSKIVKENYIFIVKKIYYKLIHVIFRFC